MTSGNALLDVPAPAEFTSGNRSGNPAGLPQRLEAALAEYAAALRQAPLAPASRTKYLSRTRGSLAWLADTAIDGDPLAEASAGTGRSATTADT
jgi:hypothetical protein